MYRKQIVKYSNKIIKDNNKYVIEVDTILFFVDLIKNMWDLSFPICTLYNNMCMMNAMIYPLSNISFQRL